LAKITGAIANGDMPSILDRAFAFDDLLQAHAYVESNQAAGKIVIVL
jgi:NADPH:quinone reductase-like Zn-dependent oxidoreductase